MTDRPAAPSDRWRSALHALADAPEPLLVIEEAATPAASVWTGSRAYVQAFRDAGLVPGDRILLDIPPSVAFVQALVAAIWEGLTVVPAAPGTTTLDAVDARAAIRSEPSPHAWTPDDVGGPAGAPTLRTTTHGPTPDARFLLRTSGTSGSPTWVALSDANVWAVLDAHRDALALDGARTVSMLPWHHAFGLVLDLIPSLLDASEIVRDPHGGREVEALADLAEVSETTHLSMVPLTARRLSSIPRGKALLARLASGLIGGAPITPDVADAVRGTALRVGYGQTEAAPGIAFGDPGQFEPNILGREAGCDVALGQDGLLSFRGPNASLGTWDAATGLTRLDPDRWVPTGDLAERRGENLYFRGRAGDTFKLSNGRFVRAGDIEARLRADVPGVIDAALHSPDGERLALDLLAEEPREDLLGPVRRSLGPMARRLGPLRVHTPTTWPVLPKGSPDRQALSSPSHAFAC